MLEIATSIHENSDALSRSKKWDLAFVGKAIDKRGEAACQFAKERSSSVVEVSYNVARNCLCEGDRFLPLKSIQEKVKPLKSVLVESTSMGVAELATVFRACYGSYKHPLDVLYVEPKDYTLETGSNSSPKPGRRFMLSSNKKFQGVPGFVLDLNQYDAGGKAVFFLGYEGERLQQSLEQVAIESWHKTAVFGMPSFEAGWESNAFANNVSQLAEGKFLSIQYCPAASVFCAYNLLTHLHKTTPDPSNNPTLVAPLGTKPHSIAAALFLCSHSAFGESGLLYDHPELITNRSNAVRSWHLYEIRGF